MLLNLTEVVLKEGKVIEPQADLTTDVLSFPFGSYRIVKKAPVMLRIENRGGQVLSISGSTSLEAAVPCDRCLEEVIVPLSISFDLKADMKQSNEERLEALDESAFIQGYNLDVDTLVCGEALLNWPSRVLCKEDCKGLCRVCGINLNRGTCSCDDQVTDPRMAKIRDIFSSFKEV